MFQWFFNGIAGMWFAWNYWSIVPVLVFISLSILAYKRATAPTSSLQQNFKDNRRESSQAIPTMRKFVNLIMITTILIMGGTLFAISMFKMGW